MSTSVNYSSSSRDFLANHTKEKLEKSQHTCSKCLATNVLEVEVETSPGEPSELDMGLAPVDNGRQAWIFVFSACIFDSFIWGWNNTYGLFQEYYATHPPFDAASSGEISIIGTTSVAIQYIEVILIIALFQRYPELPKPSMWASLAMCVGALILSSFATKVWQLIILQGIVFGIGAGVFYAPILIWLSDWFVERRGLAGGIIFGGSGVGGFVLPIAMGYLLKNVGFGWAIRTFGLVLGVCGGIALLGVNPRLPLRKPITYLHRKPWFPKDLSPFRNPVFLCMMVINSVQALGFYPVSIFLTTYTSYLSAGTFTSTVTLALFNAASVICYVLFGRICDSFPYSYVIFTSGFVSALAALLLWGYASTLGIIFAFTVVFGGFNGGFPGTWPAAASEIGTRNEVTSLMMGTFAIVKGIGAIVGPAIAATLRDSNNDSPARYGGFGFLRVEMFVGAMAVATSIGGLALSFISVSKRIQKCR
ncbi:Aspyridones efflux protein apdF [Psilocybe cubensis]|uniref:Aspyridones efflux protein apdF n=2 Tax=Psilocybe cubensis TaxID=181762 RepID=A0ACB8HF76_PSICU|nr:Aspyridones efflux protein apdF [Psilocybe cubensis]KAH9485839.1 Aspyridones efflux protein apdF [Psilocybe cubensis]